MSDGNATTATGQPGSGGTGMRAGMDQALDWARRKPMIPMLLGVAAVIAVVAAMLLWAGGPDYRVLYSNLSEGDGGKIISTLDQQGVKYKFAQGGHTLLVPSDKVYKLRMELAQKGLPAAGNVGFKVMDDEAFGISQFAEHVNYMRGLQGELANSIEVLRPVRSARVHLALPKRSIFVRKRKPAKATVVLTLQPGRALGAGQVNAIVNMVASSVRDLAPDDVTVVDQTGHLLSASGAGHGLDDTQLDYLHKVEQHYQDRIEHILTPILGPGNVHAQVTAQLDFSQREETSEHYAPNQGDHPATVRSRQHSSSWNDGHGSMGGVPGALTNTPPGAAASPINQTPADKAKAGQAGTPGKSDSADVAKKQGEKPNASDRQHGDMQRHDTTNYEVDRDVTHIKRPQGSIKRLSAAVVVNYRTAKQKDGSVKEVPLDKDTMAQITQLTHEAMGFSASRGDSVHVFNSLFRTPAEPAAPAWWKQIDWGHWIHTLGRYLIALIIALLLYRMIVRPLRKRYQESREVATSRPATTDGDNQPPEEETRAKPRRRKSATYEQGMHRLREMATEEPGMVAMIVRNWMNRDA